MGKDRYLFSKGIIYKNLFRCIGKAVLPPQDMRDLIAYIINRVGKDI